MADFIGKLRGLCSKFSPPSSPSYLFPSSSFFLPSSFTLPLTLLPDITRLPTRGPCSKYTLDLEEGKFRGELKLTFEGEPFKVRGGGVHFTIDVRQSPVQQCVLDLTATYTLTHTPGYSLQPGLRWVQEAQ